MNDATNAPSGPARAEALYGRLKPLQEAKGYFFNPDMEITLSILEELLLFKEKYGYMCCPCRLSTGNREKDSDIFCPCDYREADVKEYGTCFCGLYVDRDAYEGRKLRIPIPERRPIEKTLA